MWIRHSWSPWQTTRDPQPPPTALLGLFCSDDKGSIYDQMDLFERRGVGVETQKYESGAWELTFTIFGLATAVVLARLISRIHSRHFGLGKARC